MVSVFSISFFFQSWDAYFRSNTYCAPPSFSPVQKNQMPLSQLAPLIGGGALAGAEPDEKIIDDHLAVQAIIRSYQVMWWFICMQFYAHIIQNNSFFFFSIINFSQFSFLLWIHFSSTFSLPLKKIEKDKKNINSRTISDLYSHWVHSFMTI